MRKLLMVRYGEIYLKGLNRPYFLRALVSRVREAAKPFGGKVWLHDARVFVSDMNFAGYNVITHRELTNPGAYNYIH